MIQYIIAINLKDQELSKKIEEKKIQIKNFSSLLLPQFSNSEKELIKYAKHRVIDK